ALEKLQYRGQHLAQRSYASWRHQLSLEMASRQNQSRLVRAFPKPAPSFQSRELPAQEAYLESALRRQGYLPARLSEPSKRAQTNLSIQYGRSFGNIQEA